MHFGGKKKSLHPWVEWLSTIRNFLANAKFFKSAHYPKRSKRKSWQCRFFAGHSGYNSSRVCLVRTLTVLFGNEFYICAQSDCSHRQPQILSCDKSFAEGRGDRVSWAGSTVPRQAVLAPENLERRTNPLDFDVLDVVGHAYIYWTI